ncbi:MAG: beta-ketoacyl synthase chain length factor [Desulfuromonadaceae bacterium]|nr:beta-ketoacyl synthase chain length factor [Desulfuromonadaceae bacterium]
MTRLSIRGVGVVGGFGCGLEAFDRALVSGVASTMQVTPVPGNESVLRSAFLADTAPLEEFLNKRALRRIDHFSRLALLGSHLALQDAGMLGAIPERVGLVIASGYGALRTTFSFLDSIIEDGDSCASPTHFSNSVHNAAAAHVAIKLNIGGPNLTVSQFEMSVSSALLTAQLWLEEGRVDHVVFGGVDEYSAVLGYCWERFLGSESTEEMAPFDLARQTALVGEGSAFFVLSREETASPYGAIDRVSLGHLSGGLPILPKDPVYILGADGHRQCSAKYPELVPQGASVASYAPLYGSLPVGQAFDLAAAALAMRDGRLCATPGHVAGETDWQIVGTEELGQRDICCLKMDDNGGYGFLTVTKGRG